jgi:ribosome-associated protein
MIIINDSISINEDEIRIDFVQASGPGGQNVNKVASKAQLRFDTNSPSLPDEVRERLRKMARNRITGDGIWIIEAGRFRTQEQNRDDAINRLVEIIRKAAEKPKVRRKTRPTIASKLKRLEIKRRRSDIKRLRRRLDDS